MRGLAPFPAFLAALCLLAAGCSFSPPPDPNDPTDVTVIQADVLRRNLKWASDAANRRVALGEISENEAKALVTAEADRLVESIDLSKVPVADAWEYGEVFLTAERWSLAEQALRIAVKNAKTEDRRVNDSLRLAKALAKQRKVKEAIETARTVFNAPPSDKAPILPAVLLEIVPAAEGQKENIELAKLLEEAIGQHESTVVDWKSEPGQAFMMAKPHHISNAWAKVMELYRKANRPDLLEAAAKRAADRRGSRIRV